MKTFFQAVFAVLIFVAILYGVISCFRAQRKSIEADYERYVKWVAKNNAASTLYEVVFTDDGADTIKVWGDIIYMTTDDGSNLLGPTKGPVTLYYVPFRKYREDEVTNNHIDSHKNKLYNVIRFKKIKK